MRRKTSRRLLTNQQRAEQIHVELLLHLQQAQGAKLAVMKLPGVIDHNIGRAKVRLRGVEQPLDVRFAGNIRLYRQPFAAQRANIAHHIRCAHFILAVVDHYARAGRGERRSNRRANALRGARHQRNFSVKCFHLVSPPEYRVCKICAFRSTGR